MNELNVSIIKAGPYYQLVITNATNGDSHTVRIPKYDAFIMSAKLKIEITDGE